MGILRRTGAILRANESGGTRGHIPAGLDCGRIDALTVHTRDIPSAFRMLLSHCRSSSCNGYGEEVAPASTQSDPANCGALPKGVI